MPRTLTVERPDGVSIWVEHHGPELTPGRLAILILDGIGCSGWAFERVIPQLAARHPVLVVHHRGHGKSSTPARPWALDMGLLADDAAAAARAAGATRALVVGFSMGFQVALELYRRHPPLCAGLVSLAGPAGRVLDSFQRTKAFGYLLGALNLSTRIAGDWVRRAWDTLTRSSLAREVAIRFQVNADRINPVDLEVYARQMAGVDPEFFMALLAAAHRHDAADLLASIDVPTRIIAGARDTFVPLESMRAIAEAIPGVLFSEIEAATHALPAEYPARVADEILECADALAGA